MDLVHLPHTWHVPPNSLILLHSRPCVPGQLLLTAMPSPWAHPAHLVVVSEVTDPHVLAHVGVVKVLPKPADITPVEIPLPFAGGRGGTEVRTEDLSTAGGLGWGSWGVTLGVSRRWFWAAAAHHVLGEACENYRPVRVKTTEMFLQKSRLPASLEQSADLRSGHTEPRCPSLPALITIDRAHALQITVPTMLHGPRQPANLTCSCELLGS